MSARLLCWLIAVFVCVGVGCGDDGGSGSGGGGNGGSGGGAGSLCQAQPSANPTLPNLADVDPDVVARAAAVIAACWPDDGVDRNALHLWDSPRAAPFIYYRLLTQLQCIADANCGCETLSHCLGQSFRGGHTACTPGCDGSVWSACSPSEANVHIDCGRLGLQCDDARGCVESEDATCTAMSPTCDGDGRPVFCQGSTLWHGPRCGDYGLSCAEGVCTGAGAECDASAEPDLVSFAGETCTDNVLHACVGSRTHDVDCATLGPLTCHAIGDHAYCGLDDACVPPDSGSRSPSDPPRCDGTDLVYCHLGRFERIDCLSLGFTGCNIDRARNEYGCTPGIDLEQ